MIYDVYIWGTGKLARYCLDDLMNEKINILGFVQSVIGEKKEAYGYPVISGKELLEKTYDYIILANSQYEEIISEYSLDNEKIIIYPREVISVNNCIRYDRKWKNEISLFNSDNTIEALNRGREIMPYVSMEIDGISFIFDRLDYLIPTEMLFNKKVYSLDEMLFFSKYIENHKGIFFDIGANVGTTTLYFRKKIERELQYHSFEPVFSNYKCLKLNCIVNDCEDIRVMNVGLSDSASVRTMGIIAGAPGSSAIDYEGNYYEECEFITLDEYVKANGIDSKTGISGIWVDIQGHEYEFIKGSVETLKESNAPVFLEFNYEIQIQRGIHDSFVNLISGIYNDFICYEQYSKGINKKRPIHDLKKLHTELDGNYCNILLLK